MDVTFSARVAALDRLLSSTSGLSSRARLVGVAMAHALGPADGGGGFVSWLSIKTLARRTALSEATVKRAVRELVDAELPVFERVRHARWTRRGKAAPKRSAVVRLVTNPAAYRKAHPVRQRSARAAPPPVLPPDAASGMNQHTTPSAQSEPLKTAATPPAPAPTSSPSGFGSMVDWIASVRAKLDEAKDTAHGEPLTLAGKDERSAHTAHGEPLTLARKHESSAA